MRLLPHLRGTRNQKSKYAVLSAPYSSIANCLVEAIPSSSLEIKDVERLFNVYIDKDFDDDDEENPDSSWIPDSPGETQASTKWLGGHA